jgi:hypothetical protein
MLTAARLREVLNYDPETGVVTWLVRAANCIRIGDIAGCINPKGYHQVRIDRATYRTHRLAFLYMTGEWPPNETDHINGDKADNRWTNLRLATRSQNQANLRKMATNTSGYKGVRWHKGKWEAKITVNGQQKYLGYFDCPATAHAVYAEAAKKHFNEFARAA